MKKIKMASGLSLALIMQNVAFSGETTKLDEVQVVTTASGFEQNIAQAPASISVIKAEELQKKAYTDVVDVVKNIPGVYVAGGANNQDITIRGMGSSYTMYMVDGRPISAGRAVNTNGADGGKVGSWLPPIDAIDRIEIIRGPMSSLYGSDAMGGVINIITKKASSDVWKGAISTEYTKSANDISNDLYNTSFYLSGPLIQDKLSLALTGAYYGNDESDYTGGEDGASSESDKSTRKIGSELTWSVDEHNDISLLYDFSRQEEKRNPGKSLEETASPYENENEKSVYTVSHKGTYQNFITNTYYQDETTDKIYNDTDDEKQEILRTFNTQSSVFLGNHILTFGAQYKYEELTDTTNGMLVANIPGAVKSVDRWIAALFVEDEWSITEDFALTFGARYNDDEFFNEEITPRIYGVYQLTHNLTLKAGVSTGYKQPKVSDISEGFGQRTGKGSAIIIGNPELEPEKSVNYEAGFNYTNDDIGLVSSLMIFQTDYKDKIQETRLCETPGTTNSSPQSQWKCSANGETWRFVSTKENIDDAQILGIEFTTDYDLTDRLTTSTSYTYTKSEQKSGDFKGEPLNKMPKHMVNVGLDYDISKEWNAWTQYNYRGETSDYLSRTAMSEGTPAYGFFDAGIIYQASKTLQLKAGIYNIANKEITNVDYGVVLEGRRYTFGMNVKF